MIDMLKNSIQVGDRIVYPVKHSTRASLETGVILDAVCSCGAILASEGWTTCSDTTTFEKLRVQKNDGKVVYLTRSENIVVVR